MTKSTKDKNEKKWQFELYEGDIFCMPTSAVDRDKRYDDIEDSDSDYSKPPEDIREFDDAVDSHDVLLNSFARLGIDSDGRPLLSDMIFRDEEEASSFIPFVVGGHPVEIACITLWEYFGGTSCLEMNCWPKTIINVVAEEYQICPFSSDEYLRLPILWSFGYTNISSQRAEALLFRHWWYFGICGIEEAIQFILQDPAASTPGFFGICSPQWINLNPTDDRPYILMFIGKTGRRKYGKHKENPADGSTENAAVQHLRLEKKKLLLGSESKDSGSRVQLFTISRCSSGQWEIFGHRFWTLYDLVFYLSNNTSTLPCRLNYKIHTRPPPFLFSSVPPPSIQPKRDLHANIMKIEQWAAMYYDKSLLPSSSVSPLSFSIRSVLDPMKKMHAKFMKMAGLSNFVNWEANLFLSQFNRPKKKEKNKEMEQAKNKEKKEEVKNDLKDASQFPPDEMVLLGIDSFQLPLDDISYKKSKPLGKGAFGAVYAGSFKTKNNKTENVAIKTQRLICVERDQRPSWIGEIEILHTVYHPNIVLFYGFSIDPSDSTVLMLFEMMTMGSLDSFCKKIDYKLSVNEQVDFLIQIIRGLGHLHSSIPSIVHGDLAARNVLLNPHPTDNTRYILKLTDFGLSKKTRSEVFATYDDPHKIPFKWLPPEVLTCREMSPASDIWSYGVLTHELYGIGEPYGMVGPEKVIHLLNDGHRFERQPLMPHFIYEIVLRCWRKQAVDRPTCNEIEILLLPHVLDMDSVHMNIIKERKEDEKKPKPIIPKLIDDEI